MTEALAIGRFDGLHLGHQKLFSYLGDNGAILLIDTKKSNLTPPKSIARYTHLPVFLYELDAIKSLGAHEFVAKLKSDFPQLKKIVIGDDFRFAKDRSADANELKTLFDGETIIVDELKIEGKGAHSRLIRSLIVEGNVKEASKYLGREYEVCGKHVSGQGIGAQKLVPTINVDGIHQILPKEGVYATRTEIEGVWHPSVTFVGHRVSTDGNFAVETHILDEFRHGCLESVCIRLVDKVRDNRYFDGIDELKEAIASDIETARHLVSKK